MFRLFMIVVLAFGVQVHSASAQDEELSSFGGVLEILVRLTEQNNRLLTQLVQNGASQSDIAGLDALIQAQSASITQLSGSVSSLNSRRTNPVTFQVAIESPAWAGLGRVPPFAICNGDCPTRANQLCGELDFARAVIFESLPIGSSAQRHLTHLICYREGR